MQPFINDVVQPPPEEDVQVGDNAVLWRRIGADWILPEEDGTEKISSAAFLDRVDGNLSVHIAALTTVEQVKQAYPHSRIAQIEARIAIERGFTIIQDPQPDDPSHAILRPPTGARTKNMKREDARALARSAVLID